MKKMIFPNLHDLFRPRETMGLDVYAVLEGLGDSVVRKNWLFEVLSEVKRINLSIDQMLSSGGRLSQETLIDLSARRRAIQFVLESALAAKRDVARQRGQNPASKGELDLDSVTLRAAP